MRVHRKIWRFASQGAALLVLGIAGGVSIADQPAQTFSWPNEASEKESRHESAQVTAADIPALEQAAEQGDVRKQVILGRTLLHGPVGLRDYAKAAFWLGKAANQGNASAMYLLGGMYLRGQGVTQDSVAALKWTREAAALRYPEAIFMVGNAYENGQGVAVDLAEARRWYREAADMGLPVAQRFMGDFYIAGIGVEQDFDAAERWYRLAASQEDKAGEYFLRRLLQTRRPMSALATSLVLPEDSGMMVMGNTYANEFFRFRYTLPTGWHFGNEAMLDAFDKGSAALSNRKLFGDRGVPPSVTAIPLRSSFLFIAFKGPTKLYPIVIARWVVDPVSPDADTHILTSPLVNDPNAETVGKLTKVRIGGREFSRLNFRMEKDENKVLVDRLVTLIPGTASASSKHFLIFDLGATSHEDLAEAIKSIDTLTFFPQPAVRRIETQP